MSDNAPAKVVTVWPWHYDEPALYIFCKVDDNSNKLLVLLEPNSSFTDFSIDYGCENLF